jgi:3-hydroxyanthranilate 3,4-dioxygenase
MRWYCERCQAIVYEERFYCTDLGTQLKPVIEKYYADKAMRTCRACNHVNPVPKLINDQAILTYDQ